jgi:DNA-binding transcriptional MocR family regulator
MDTVLETLGPEALGYAPGQGLERLRVLIAKELARSGIDTSADEILITTGSQQALDLVARALVNPGDVFLTEGRTYSGALNILTACGAEVVGVPGDDEGPDIPALKALARRRPKGLYLMPSSRNPTGTSISDARRQALVDWSRSAGVPLIEDDYGADLELDPGAAPQRSLRARDENVFHVSTYSKKLIPALRVGFIVCPPQMRGPLTRLKHAMDLGTSTLLQHALAEFLERGLLAAHLGRVTSAYRERRDALVGALREALPEEITFRPPDRGVVLWLSLPPGLDPEVAYEAARAEGVLVSSGSVYTAIAPSPGGLRLTYCSEPPERLAEGARRLGRALKKLLSRPHGADRVELMGA